MGKKLTLAACLVAFGLGAYLYFTPYIAVHRMRDAARAFDSEAFSEYVDFPAVRENLKTEIRSRIADTTGSRSGLGALGTAVAGAFIDPMVDTLVTPESLALMLQGTPPNEGDATPGSAGVEASMHYERFDTFVVAVEAMRTPALAFEFVLTRVGLLGWKLTAVRLPEQWSLPGAPLERTPEP